MIEWDEWGNPLESAEAYAYMKSYAPYENVGAHAYPAILAVTSLHDTRVLYVEPAKWVARLRATAKATRRSCSRPRCTRVTAASADATRRGRNAPGSWPGSSTWRVG